MKKLFLVVLMFSFTSLFSQSIVGKWKTIDDETGKAKSIVEIYKGGNQFYAKIIKLLKKPANTKCVACKGAKKNKNLVGLEFVYKLKKDGQEWNDGFIMDPSTGKEYKCYMELLNPNKLKVRGFLGFSFLGRTQYWYRVK